MTYTKQTWINDDPTKPLSASRMGHIEDGIEAAQNAVDAIDIPNLADVATSGSYDDLTGKPTIPSTKSDVGLGSVDNTTDAGKPVSTATQTALDLKAPLASPTFTGTVAGVTKAHVGLGSVDNTADTAKPVSTATQSALDAKAPIASPTFTGTVSGVTKAHVGLGSVDNTADAAKNVLSATKLATARTIAVSGAVSGSGSFDGSGNLTITTTQIPAVGTRAYNTGTSSWPARPTCTMCIATGGTSAPGDAVTGDIWVKDA